MDFGRFGGSKTRQCKTILAPKSGAGSWFQRVSQRACSKRAGLCFFLGVIPVELVVGLTGFWGLAQSDLVSGTRRGKRQPLATPTTNPAGPLLRPSTLQNASDNAKHYYAYEGRWKDDLPNGFGMEGEGGPPLLRTCSPHVHLAPAPAPYFPCGGKHASPARLCATVGRRKR